MSHSNMPKFNLRKDVLYPVGIIGSSLGIALGAVVICDQTIGKSHRTAEAKDLGRLPQRGAECAEVDINTQDLGSTALQPFKNYYPHSDRNTRVKAIMDKNHLSGNHRITLSLCTVSIPAQPDIAVAESTTYDIYPSELTLANQNIPAEDLASIVK
jgi:hypothetical protein